MGTRLNRLAQAPAGAAVLLALAAVLAQPLWSGCTLTGSDAEVSRLAEEGCRLRVGRDAARAAGDAPEVERLGREIARNKVRLDAARRRLERERAWLDWVP
jgi:hypothetical protein